MGRVFVNRTLNLKRIRYLGFDMDHTLVRYKSENFERLAHRTMIQKLVNEKGYPESIQKLPFSYDRAIRGLIIDKAKGNTLKLSRHSAIRVSYHGLKPIDYREQGRVYKSVYIDLRDPNFLSIDTSFSIAHAALFMQLVDLHDSDEQTTLPDYAHIAEDLNFVLDRAHRDGSLKDEVRKNLDQYIIKDEALVCGLERFKKHGKKLFVVTNSDFSYSKLLLDYTINPFVKEHKGWEDLFEIVVTSAAKPRFFVDNQRFLKIDPKTGLMSNMDQKLEPGIYQGGSANVFTNDLDAAPDEILYIGDHIYGDILRLKKDLAWRTALVVEELEEEIAKESEAAPLLEKVAQLMDKKFPLEIKIDKLISEQIEKGVKTHEDEIHRLLGEISEIDKSVSPLLKQQQQLFNPYWGEVMRTGIEESYFAHQVDRFACVYMAKLADLMNTSPRTYFRSWRRPLAHDLEIAKHPKAGE
ncbi:MAG: HAD-IG family 5'-nucleotidase [Bdellovibrionaceae bacterium]|nr:HAD-IG family 5'-nucleotidase [Pseudobdellovibrionaceae bacterium]